MLKLIIENSFDKDLKRELKSGLDTSIITPIINKLQSCIPLDPKQRDHQLKGNLKGLRECHIKPDLLLIYRITESELFLIRLGSHSKLFKK